MPPRAPSTATYSNGCGPIRPFAVVEHTGAGDRRTGEPQALEPEKCVSWGWWPADAMPEPTVAYTRAAIDGIRHGRPYTELGWAGLNARPVPFRCLTRAILCPSPPHPRPSPSLQWTMPTRRLPARRWSPACARPAICHRPGRRAPAGACRLDQATDRAYRIGQDRPVEVRWLTTQGAVEDRVSRLLGAKRAVADQVIASSEAALSEVSDADLAELVALSHGADV
ncbi:hypothetical protein ABZ468_53295 [Streptomyces sp. NPDC005708]|uniref:hypothetical protein n=1 Tax=Streptomyces sp. NPDC005708 TaxID=3154564 RepID=UPI0033EEB548